MDISGNNFELISCNRTFCYDTQNTIIYIAQCSQFYLVVLTYISSGE